MADETKVVVEDGTATAAAAAGAGIAAVAANDAVKTATELAADQGRVLAEETRLYREGIDRRIGEFGEGISKWQTESQSALTTFQSQLMEKTATLETQIQQTKAETAAALETLAARLTQPKQEPQTQELNIQEPSTRTEVPEKSPAEKQAAPKKRIIRRI